MSIVDNLKLIINAQKGKDVRQAIHDGIQQCYADGKSGAIDLEARMLLEEKTSVDDSNIKTTDTYSSNKIESLIANSNYKKAVLKQKITDGLNGGSAYISQISNMIFIDFVNCVVTGNVTNLKWITYSTNIPAALYPVNKPINDATLSINAGDRTIKVTTTKGAGHIDGSIMFLAESSDNYTDETINDIQASLANVNEFVDVINEIPLTYKRKNLLKNTAVSYVSNGITYTVNNDKSVTMNGTATVDSVLQIANDYNFGNVSCLVSGCENGSDSTYFLQVGNSSYSLGVKNYNGDTPITFSKNELYSARIVVKSDTIVNNVTIKPMIRFDTVINSNYEQYVEDAQTRMRSLEAEVEELKSVEEYVGLVSSVNHRNIYRGKSLGSSVTAAQKADIQNGSFDDLFIGDYWTIGGINYRIADMNYWLNCGDTSFTKQHLVIVPDTNLYSAKMNETNITTGGYVGSKMYTENLAQAKTIIASAFGDLLLTHREYLVNAVANGKPFGGGWFDSNVELMNEVMIFGTHFFCPANDGTTNATPTRNTIDNSQLALFALNPRMIKTRENYWERDVVSSVAFAHVFYGGTSGAANASDPLGVRPAFPIG